MAHQAMMATVSGVTPGSVTGAAATRRPAQARAAASRHAWRRSGAFGGSVQWPSLPIRGQCRGLRRHASTPPSAGLVQTLIETAGVSLGLVGVGALVITSQDSSGVTSTGSSDAKETSGVKVAKKASTKAPSAFAAAGGSLAAQMKEAVKQVSGTKGPELEWGVAEDMGPRDYMEDAWVVHERGVGGYLFAGVFDGHGGYGSSAFLKESLYELLSKGVGDAKEAPVTPGQAGKLTSGYLEAALQDGFERADEELIDHLARLGEPECWSGSTCTTCFVRDDRVVVANVGDSRAVLLRSAGKPVELTQDHRPLGYFKTGRTEIDRVNRCGGWVTAGRVCGILAVSRAFGDFEFKGGRFELLEELQAEGTNQAKKATLKNPPVTARPDVAEIARDPTDEFIVMATDGLWDTLNSQQAGTFVKAELKKKPDMTMKEVSEALVQRALRYRTQDNVACVVLDLRQKEPATEA